MFESGASGAENITCWNINIGTKAQITWCNKKIIELNEALKKNKNWEIITPSYKARSKKVIKALIDAVKLVVTWKNVITMQRKYCAAQSVIVILIVPRNNLHLYLVNLN